MNKFKINGKWVDIYSSSDVDVISLNLKQIAGIETDNELKKIFIYSSGSVAGRISYDSEEQREKYVNMLKEAIDAV